MLSFLEAGGRRPYSAEADLIDFIAHEMHHIGYREIVKDQLSALQLDEREELIDNLLVSVVTEGGATYLVSGHRDMERVVASDSGVARLSGRGDDLLAELERVLAAIEAGGVTDSEQFDAAPEFLLGSGPHPIGSLMISRIDSGSGLDAVMSVLADPRRLLVAYNEALGGREPGDGAHVFDPDLTKAMARVGDPSS
jgi:hypothetical protein